MTPDDILSLVKLTMDNQFGYDQNDVQMESAFTDLGADELDVVELCMALDERFSTEIPNPQDMRTVGDIVSYIMSHT